MPAAPSIVWFRSDLRLDDNAALREAIARGGTVIPLFIWSTEEESPWRPGAASRVWLHDSLTALDDSLRKRGSRLTIARGESIITLERLIKRVAAGAVFWNRRYEPLIIQRDALLKKRLRDAGVHAESFNAALLHEPWEVRTKEGKPYQVFTPYWKASLSMAEPAEPTAAPRGIPSPTSWPESLAVDDLQLVPARNWYAGIRGAWQPGERGARSALKTFLSRTVQSYSHDRDRPDVEGTSRLSPHLHFGEISPRRLWHEVTAFVHRPKTRGSDVGVLHGAVEKFLAEVGWREFAHHLLYHFPHTDHHPLREQFVRFPWRKDSRALRAWQRGKTGYPIVDAGMRQLWTTGWMHNRVRMVTASFLVKHLLLPWQLGAKWFWDTLVDADLANNTLGWQWVAGCGADAAPYFRIFNPTSQGEKFDVEGSYVRAWIPELARLPAAFIHRPWEAPPLVLAAAGVELGKTYPEPIVDHATARRRALDALDSIKR